MKHTIKTKARLLLFLLVLALALTACSSSEISVDENGVASWKAVKGAVKYEYIFVDGTYTNDGQVYYTDQTWVQLPEHYSVHVHAVMENGEYGEWMISDYYGDPDVTPEQLEALNSDVYVDPNYDVKWEDLKTYEVISNIDYSTVKTLDDGSVYFEAAAPDGGVMRFVGKGISVTQGAITLEVDGEFCALDAIGRICAVSPHVTDPGHADNTVEYTGGYTFTDATSVESADELFMVWGFGVHTSITLAENPVKSSHMDFQPNFIGFRSFGLNQDAFTISALEVYYDEVTYNTGIADMYLNTEFYASYFDGDPYDTSREVYDSANEIYTFYLLLRPELRNAFDTSVPEDLMLLMPKCLLDIDDSKFTIGNLKDADGNVYDRTNAPVTEGCTLEVTVADYTKEIELPVIDQYQGARTMHDLVPYGYPEATGTLNTLVIPIAWQDQPQNATDEILAMFRSELGRVMDEKGNVKDYSDQLADAERFSLSEYYDMASYGQLQVQSYLTDWYPAPYNFSEMKEQSATGGTFMEELTEWLYSAYPDMDWSKFDQDANGYFDSVVLINAGTSDDDWFVINSFSGGVHYLDSYIGDRTGTQEKPAFNSYVCMSANLLKDNTLLHEFAHGLGLIDYYDVSYSGIDAVGGFDMQSGSYGDWNAYSKYAVGWLEPEVVQGLASGESVELTIGALADEGDAIVIPAAGKTFDGPFDEYILIDLFTDSGVNEFDVARCDLSGVTGVRISHVDARMEKRELTDTENPMNTEVYPIGTIHYPNMYNEKGLYNIEVIQAGGTNTFTKPSEEGTEPNRTQLRAEDLFRAGDVFTAESYSEFLTDGRMDDGSEFGYSVEVVSIGTDADGHTTATIRITAK